MYFKGETVKGSEMAELDESVTDKSPFAHGYFQNGKGPPAIRVWVEVLNCKSQLLYQLKNTGDSGLPGPD